MSQQTQKIEPKSTWWTEGNRKLVMTIAALFIFGAVVLGWLITQPEGVALTDLASWVGEVVLGILGIGVGGNVIEHVVKRAKGGGSGGGNISKVGIVLLFGVVAWMGSGCSSTPEIVGPGLQLQLIEGPCGAEWHGSTTATAKHPALWPKGATQETTTTVETRIYNDCDEEVVTPPVREKEAGEPPTSPGLAPAPPPVDPPTSPTPQPSP